MVSVLTQHGGISLELIPMQLPEAVPQRRLLSAGFRELAITQEQKNPSLIAHPGEPAWMTVQVENWKASSLQLIVWVKGNFPDSWCQLVPETPKQITNTRSSSDEWHPIDAESIEIPAKGKWSGELLLCIPDNFFEDWQAIKYGNKNRLNLDWRGSISVYTRHSHNDQPVVELMEQVDFDLYVRPHSHQEYVGRLPFIYREQDFVNRFISIFEQAFDPVVNSCDSMWANLDPLTCPQGLLPFFSPLARLDTRSRLESQPTATINSSGCGALSLAWYS